MSCRRTVPLNGDPTLVRCADCGRVWSRVTVTDRTRYKLARQKRGGWR